MKSKLGNVPFIFSIFLLIVLSCTFVSCSIKKSETPIDYDYTFYIDNISSNIPSTVDVLEKYKNQYEFVALPVDWNQPNGEKFKLRVFHANPNYKIVNKAFLFAIGGPGEPLDEKFATKINKAFGDDWDFIVFDHRGAALSAFTEDNKRLGLKYLTIEQSAEDMHALVKLLRKKDIQKLVVGGDSAGALLSLQYAIKYSDEIDLLYIDGGASSAEFMNISNSKVLKMITEKLKPDSIGSIAEYYNVNPDLMFETLMNFGAEDPGLKEQFWNDFKEKNKKAEKKLKDYFADNILVPPFNKKEKLIDEIVTTQRLYYTIGCLEYLPIKQGNSLYTFLKSYNDLLKIFEEKFSLKKKPFNVEKGLSKIKAKTIITDGLDDYIIPFENSRRIYKLMNNDNAILFGMKNTAHVVIITDHYMFIAKVIKSFVDGHDIAYIKQLIKSNTKAILY